MIRKLPPPPRTSLVKDAAEVVARAPDSLAAKAALAQVVSQVADGFSAPASLPDVGPTPTASPTSARLQGDVLERRLQQTIRALRRESKGRDAPLAGRALAHEAIRLMIEVDGWRRVADLSATPGNETAANTLQALLTHPAAPDRHRRIAALCRAPLDVKAGASPERSRPLTGYEASALVDVLASLDPSHGTTVRERLQNGADPREVRDLLVERLVPVSANAKTAPADASQPDEMAGLKFDLSINQYVPKDQSYSYAVPLGQLFEYRIAGLMDGREELCARLRAQATDPTTGELSVPEARIEQFVTDLADAASSGDPAIKRLLSTKLDLCFSVTDHGRKPVGVLFELPLPCVADLFAAIGDEGLSARVSQLAQAARQARGAQSGQNVEKLRDLLAKYDGVPVRHKRAHAALINMGLAGQTVAELGAPDGVIPKDRTRLTPEILATRFADAEELKLRFLFTGYDDRTSKYVGLDMFVIDDDFFDEVVEKWHFPPNHELLSYNQPIAGSGYVTVHRGRIVGLEDDTIMLPGKMPDNLPPALEVLRGLGFALDEDRVAASFRVVDWENFLGALQKAPLPPAPDGDLAALRAQLSSCAHGERPALIGALLAAELQKARAQTGSEPAALERTTRFTSELLEGFYLINVAAKDFREGHLPSHLNEFSDLHVDAALAECLVRKVAATAEVRP